MFIYFRFFSETRYSWAVLIFRPHWFLAALNSLHIAKPDKTIHLLVCLIFSKNDGAAVKRKPAENLNVCVCICAWIFLSVPSLQSASENECWKDRKRIFGMRGPALNRRSHRQAKQGHGFRQRKAIVILLWISGQKTCKHTIQTLN